MKQVVTNAIKATKTYVGMKHAFKNAMLGILSPPTTRGAQRDYLKVFASNTIVTCIGWFLPFTYLALGYIYLLEVIAVSMRVGRLPALVGAVLSGAAWNFFFVPPRLSFSVLHFDEGLLLATYFVVALVCSQLTVLRSEAERASLLAKSEHMYQTLFGNVAHEIKTPLSVFSSAVEQMETVDPDKRRFLIAELRIAVRRLEGLVTNLLSQTRLEAGVLSPRFDLCHARDLVAAARRSVGKRLDQRQLDIDIPLDFSLFRADAALMEEAIGHLLVNAAIHTPVEATIGVSAGLAGEGKTVNIVVSDNGPGIPADLRDKLFRKFSRGRGAKTGGLGLGLSIVRGFMQAQGGDAYYEPAPSGGSKFILSLPFASEDRFTQ